MSSPLKQNTEVLFLIDGSKDVSKRLFERQKTFVKKLLIHFNISLNGPYGSILLYDTNTSKVSIFSPHNFTQRIDDTTQYGRPRRMDRALEQAYLQLSRSDIKGRKIAVLLTAGRDDPRSGSRSVGEAAKQLKQLGVQTFVVAIGSDHSISELQKATDKKEDVFQVLKQSKLSLQSQLVAKHIKDKPCK